MIKRCLDQTKSDLVLLQELKLSDEDLAVFQKHFGLWKGFCVAVEGALGGIGIFAREVVILSLEVSSKKSWQWISVFSKQLVLNLNIINVYGLNSKTDLKRVWGNILAILQSHGNLLFLLGGEFNAILHPSEKNGGVGWAS